MKYDMMRSKSCLALFPFFMSYDNTIVWEVATDTVNVLEESAHRSRNIVSTIILHICKYVRHTFKTK